MWIIGRLLIPLAVLLGLAALGHAFAVRGAAIDAVVPEERVWPVRTLIPVIGHQQTTILAFGEVVASRRVELRPAVVGRVMAVSPKLRNGGLVEAGEVLVALDPFQYEMAVLEARSQIAEAKARLAALAADLAAGRALLPSEDRLYELRKTEVERQQGLEQRRHAAQKRVEEAETLLEQQRQQAISRRSAIRMLEAQIEEQAAVISRLEVSMRRAERALVDTRITAPFAGVLIETDLAQGRELSAGEKIGVLQDLSALEVRFYLSAPALAELSSQGVELAGRRIEVLWDLGPERRAFAARLDRMEGRVATESGGIEWYATLDVEAGDTLLRPGAFVEVRIPGPVYSEVARLPDAAIRDGDAVFLVEKDRIVERSASIVGREGNDVLVRGDFAGLPVVTSWSPGIGPGVRVKAQ